MQSRPGTRCSQAHKRSHQDVEHGATRWKREVLFVSEHFPVPIAAHEQSESHEPAGETCSATQQSLRRPLQFRRTPPRRVGLEVITEQAPMLRKWLEFQCPGVYFTWEERKALFTISSFILLNYFDLDLSCIFSLSISSFEEAVMNSKEDAIAD